MQGKGKSMYNDRQAMDLRRRRQIRNWIILIVLVIAAFFGLRVLRNMGKTTEITAVTMPCYATQDVTPFGDSVLYYDGASIHCLSSTGSVKWSFPVGGGATFSVSENYMVVWVGSQLFIVDRNGRPSYNENMGAAIQFARVGESYAAVVIGEDTAPELIIKDLQGSQLDDEAEAFSGMLLLDMGFYGEKGEYMWTLAMDVYGTAVNTVMNTFQVGKMNTGEVSLGESLTYKVLFEDNKLRVFTTQQMYTYDYKAVQDVNSTMLVYGWKLIDQYIPSRGSASMLLAPTSQTSSGNTITELRILSGTLDRRYTLPSACVGAAVQGKNIYAFSPEYLYRADIDSQRFYGYALPLPEGVTADGFIGLTSNGRALLTNGDTVYSVALPR
ncbi:MAG: hypothetical protein E7316_06025 [Clostridiales bacterium]|nr:hypothetical protein [Clostridiales bacterium]